MRKGKLVLAAIVDDAVGIGDCNRNDISSYMDQRVENAAKQQERVIAYSDSTFKLSNRIAYDGIKEYYPYSLDGKPIAIEKDELDRFTSNIDSLVLEPTGVTLSSKKGPEIHKIKRKISQ